MTEQNERLARIETNVEFIVDTLKGEDGILKRVSELENLKNRAWGFIIAMGTASATFGALVSNKISSLFHG
jgi:hypothetical protein